MKEELIKEFEEKFAVIKKDLGFQATLKELDSVFFLKDIISRDGYVPFSLSRMICHRIGDTFMSWIGYIQSLLVPNQSSIMNCTESQMFDEKEKDNMMHLIDLVCAFVSQNAIIGLTKNKKEEAKFIDGSILLWNEKVKPSMTEITKKINQQWAKRVNEH